ncbi:hypothetical protein ACL598_17740 [Bordetella bronchialis]|uniref:hypothetical protein n=1 Tax=Bordetella bronchialis TaxID=463025 RepID=UPI003D082C9C
MTPADKPDLPAIPAWAAAIMTSHERQTLRAHIQRQIDAARADERRKVLEFAAASIDEIDDGAAPEYRACQEHIRSKIDCKEPTT